MQKYSTIIDMIELRQSGIGYHTTKKRYNIGNSTATLIMNRFYELGLSLEELKENLSRDACVLYPDDFTSIGHILLFLVSIKSIS